MVISTEFLGCVSRVPVMGEPGVLGSTEYFGWVRTEYLGCVSTEYLGCVSTEYLGCVRMEHGIFRMGTETP